MPIGRPAGPPFQDWLYPGGARSQGTKLATERKADAGESEWPERQMPGQAAAAVRDPRSGTPGGDSRRDEDRWREPSLDPLWRALAAPATQQPIEPHRAPGVAVLERVEPAIEAMLGRVVRRIAWGGDGRRGTVRVELGSGELAGAVILLESDEQGLQIDVELPAGCSAGLWRDRILERLKGRGLSVQRFDVR